MMMPFIMLNNDVIPIEKSSLFPNAVWREIDFVLDIIEK